MCVHIGSLIVTQVPLCWGMLTESEAVLVRDRGIRQGVFSAQFCCKRKTILKIKSIKNDFTKPSEF